MSRLRQRTIQAIMGLIILGCGFLGWMATAPFKAEAANDDWAVENPLAAPAPAEGFAAPPPDLPEPSAVPLKPENRKPNFVSLPAPAGYAQFLEYRVERMPATTKEFVALRDSLALSPEGSAVMFVLAINAFVEDRPFGEACLTMMLANDPMLLEEADPGAWNGYAPSKSSEFYLDHLLLHTGIARSYVYGTKVDDDYALPPFPWAVRVARNKYSALENGDLKIWIYSTGADSMRPVHLRKNDQGIWKISDFGSLPVSIRKPRPPDPL